MEEAELRHERIAGDGVDLHVVTAGTGPPVILLHGFPENWHSWRWQIPALVAAGFSVLVPDMRGYNLYQCNNIGNKMVQLVGALLDGLA